MKPDVVQVGFSGTRKGMTAEQMVCVRALLHKANAAVVHHGDCMGSDVQMHALAKEAKAAVVVHPPSDGKLRAYCAGDEVKAPRAYLTRNKAIVESCNLFIAAPDGPKTARASGTWSTINYAVKMKRKGAVVLPTGDYYELPSGEPVTEATVQADILAMRQRPAGMDDDTYMRALWLKVKTRRAEGITDEQMLQDTSNLDEAELIIMGLPRAWKHLE